MKIYGIKNCNTVQKAIRYLKDHGVDAELQDFKKLGVSDQKLEEWSAEFGWEKLINRKGTTWKKLEPELQNSITTKEKAFELMKEKTSIIKRPILETGKKTLLGFDEADYKKVV